MNYAELYHQQRVDGLILLAIPLDDPLHHELLDGRVPAVFTCRVRENDNPTNWVDSDAAGGIEQVVDHLQSLGHREIGFLSGPDNLVLARLQREGFRHALRASGLQLNPEWVRIGEYSFESGRRLAIDVMGFDRRPTALVCGDDMTAVGAIRGVQSLGNQVPTDVSITGFDDVVLAGYTVPALTTVRQDGYQKGRIAAETLIEIMNGSGPDPPRQIVLATELIVRDSSGLVPNCQENRL
jgi:DNA-binding LacI/PurR family transcriptional regulator